MQRRGKVLAVNYWEKGEDLGKKRVGILQKSSSNRRLREQRTSEADESSLHCPRGRGGTLLRKGRKRQLLPEFKEVRIGTPVITGERGLQDEAPPRCRGRSPSELAGGTDGIRALAEEDRGGRRVGD